MQQLKKLLYLILLFATSSAFGQMPQVQDSTLRSPSTSFTIQARWSYYGGMLVEQQYINGKWLTMPSLQYINRYFTTRSTFQLAKDSLVSLYSSQTIMGNKTFTNGITANGVYIPMGYLYGDHFTLYDYSNGGIAGDFNYMSATDPTAPAGTYLFGFDASNNYLIFGDRNGRRRVLTTADLVGRPDSTTISNTYVSKMPTGFGANVTGTAGNGFVQLQSQSTPPSFTTGFLRVYSDANNRFSWNNSTYSRTLQVPFLANVVARFPYKANPTLADSTDVFNTYKLKSDSTASTGYQTVGNFFPKADTRYYTKTQADARYEVPLTFNTGLTRTGNTVKADTTNVLQTKAGVFPTGDTRYVKLTGSISIGTQTIQNSTSQLKLNYSGAVSADLSTNSSGMVLLTTPTGFGVSKTTVDANTNFFVNAPTGSTGPLSRWQLNGTDKANVDISGVFSMLGIKGITGAANGAVSFVSTGPEFSVSNNVVAAKFINSNAANTAAIIQGISGSTVNFSVLPSGLVNSQSLTASKLVVTDGSKNLVSATALPANTVAPPTTTYQSSTGTTNDSLSFGSGQKHVSKAIVAGTGVTITQTATSVTIGNTNSRSAVNIVANQTMALNTDYQNISTTQYVLTLPPSTSFATQGSLLITVLSTGTGGAKISVPSGYALQTPAGATLTDGTGYVTIAQYQKIQLIPSTTTANTYYCQPLNGTITVH